MRADVEEPDAEDDVQIVERVAAIDVAKASGMVCTRVPGSVPGPAGHQGVGGAFDH